MKLFVSLKMHGIPDEDVLRRMNEVKDFVRMIEHIPDEEEIEVVNWIENDPNEPENPSRLWYLGRSIQLMNEADLVVFDQDWYEANGCWVEFVAAHVYDKPYLFSSGSWNNDIFQKITTVIDRIKFKKGGVSDDDIPEKDPGK